MIVLNQFDLVKKGFDLVMQFLIAALVLVGTPLLFFCWMHASLMRVTDADALIVLGYRCDGDRIHPLLQERLDTVLNLWRKHHYQYIIVSGGAVTSTRTEADIMKEYLVQHRVKERCILVENQSQNTVDNLIYCKRIMDGYGLQTCSIISNSFHIRRMRYIAKQLNIPAYFYARRSIRVIVKQWKPSWLEIRAFRITRTWVAEARSRIRGANEMNSVDRSETNL